MKVSNLNKLDELLRDPLPEESMFPMEIIILADPNLVEFMHDKGGPQPSSSSMDAILKFAIVRFTRGSKAKHTLFGKIRPVH